MVWFLDERVREGGTFTSPTVIRLGGEKANHRRFRDALRPDGNAVQSGDRTCVGVVQGGVGAAVCVAQLTLGAEDTLTLQSGAGKIYQSTSWPGLPTFQTAGSAADVFITSAVDLFAQFDEDGALLQTDLFRAALFKDKIIAGFLSENGTADREAVLALGVAAAFDGLGGAFAKDDASATAEDGVDYFENDFTNSGRIKRVNLKPWRTERGFNVADGQIQQLLAASNADRTWLVHVQAVGGAHRAAAFVTGHASDPQVDVLYEYGSIAFDLSGVNLRARNNSGGPLTLQYINGVIA